MSYMYTYVYILPSPPSRCYLCITAILLFFFFASAWGSPRLLSFSASRPPLFKFFSALSLSFCLFFFLFPLAFCALSGCVSFGSLGFPCEWLLSPCRPPPPSFVCPTYVLCAPVILQLGLPLKGVLGSGLFLYKPVDDISSVSIDCD